jgi:hypothetical protein
MSLPELISFNGETLNLTQWAKKLGIGVNSIRYRLNAGWPIEDALTLSRRGRGMSALADAHDIERRRYERVRNADANQLRREFKKLVHDIDRALNSFRYRLSVLVEDDHRGAIEDFQETPIDR